MVSKPIHAAKINMKKRKINKNVRKTKTKRDKKAITKTKVKAETKVTTETKAQTETKAINEIKENIKTKKNNHHQIANLKKNKNFLNDEVRNFAEKLYENHENTNLTISKVSTEIEEEIKNKPVKEKVTFLKALLLYLQKHKQKHGLLGSILVAGVSFLLWKNRNVLLHKIQNLSRTVIELFPSEDAPTAANKILKKTQEIKDKVNKLRNENITIEKIEKLENYLKQAKDKKELIIKIQKNAVQVFDEMTDYNMQKEQLELLKEINSNVQKVTRIVEFIESVKTNREID